MQKSLAIIATSFALAACVQAEGISTSPTASPGNDPADPMVAGQFFSEACLQNETGHDVALNALAKYPFTQNTNTGTFFHDNVNLSVKHVGKQCSIVFAASNSPQQDLIVFGASVNATAEYQDASVELDVKNGADGRSYILARTVR